MAHSRRSASSPEDADLLEMLRPPKPAAPVTLFSPVTDYVSHLFDPVHDQRFFHPDQSGPKRDLAGRPAGIRAHGPSRLAFKNPPIVVECIRRKVRRQVLFSRKLQGKGARRKQRRQTRYSDVRC